MASRSEPSNSSLCVPREASSDVEKQYSDASALAGVGEHGKARQLYHDLKEAPLEPRLAALVTSDLAVIDLIEGKCVEARRGFLRALEVDPDCQVARENLKCCFSEDETVLAAPVSVDNTTQETSAGGARSIKVALLSLLFNWPSTGGGTIHTAETGRFLSQAGYDVRHYFAQYPDWGMGRIDEPLGYTAEPIRFENGDWTADEIRHRFRQALDRFNPDYVIITDSWNTKPLLAEAARGYRYLLRLAALECLCPLNNVRMLINETGTIERCPRHQLSTPDICRDCVLKRFHNSGSLHQVERALAGFDEDNYAERLYRAFAEAEAVLVVNPLVEAMVSPFARKTHVVPSGFDPARFPWPYPDENANRSLKQIFFAGLIEEHMKGFFVLQEACQRLWQQRQDFEVVATGDPPGRINEFTRTIGWQSQSDLPRALRTADMLVFPTVAEEALGRSAVEAMAVGRPVIASRIGGLQFTVVDGATGLLFEPGNADDLARKIEFLMDNPQVAQRLGETGRRRFEEHYTWNVIIERHYRRLLKPVDIAASSK